MISSMLLVTAITLLCGAYVFAGFAIAKAFGWGGPYLREITRRGGEPYLSRWSLRKQTRQAGHWRAYLHRFHSPDDEGHHNHPWRWSFSIVLWGSYTEEFFKTDDDVSFLPGRGEQHQIRTRRVRWFNWIGANHYHRITELHGATTTLFFAGPFSGRSWGFWLNGRGHVHWKTRQEELGK